MARPLRLLCLAFFVCAMASCTVSPKPEPPAAPSLNGDKLTVTLQGGGMTTVIGQRGAAEPPNAIVRGYNLDNALAPAEALVLDDGSFELGLPLSQGDEVRIEVISDTSRSNPSDFVVGPDQTPRSPSRPLGDCLFVTPVQLAVTATASATILVDNQCASEVQIELPVPRRAVAGLEVGGSQTWPTNVLAGQSLEVLVQFEPTSTVTEEVILVEASLPQRDRRPITVWVE